MMEERRIPLWAQCLAVLVVAAVVIAVYLIVPLLRTAPLPELTLAQALITEGVPQICGLSWDVMEDEAEAQGLLRRAEVGEEAGTRKYLLPGQFPLQDVPEELGWLEYNRAYAFDDAGRMVQQQLGLVMQPRDSEALSGVKRICFMFMEEVEKVYGEGVVTEGDLGYLKAAQLAYEPPMVVMEFPEMEKLGYHVELRFTWFVGGDRFQPVMMVVVES